MAVNPPPLGSGRPDVFATEQCRRKYGAIRNASFVDRRIGADEEFPHDGMDAIGANYGDLESYFSDGLGLGAGERARLEARYLES